MSILIDNLILPHPGVDGGTESLGITAGETENPTRNMPRVVKFVFWRYVFTLERPFTLADVFYSILLFYIISILLIGLNGEHRLYSGLSDL
jgi:AAT family amino acid transporter